MAISNITQEPCVTCERLDDPFFEPGMFKSATSGYFDSTIEQLSQVNDPVGERLDTEAPAHYFEALSRLIAIGAITDGQGWASLQEANDGNGKEMSLYTAPFWLDPANRKRRCLEAILTRGSKVRHYIFETVAYDADGEVVDRSTPQIALLQSEHLLTTPTKLQSSAPSTRVNPQGQSKNFSVGLPINTKTGEQVRLELGSPFSHANPIAEMLAQKRLDEGADDELTVIRDNQTGPVISRSKAENGTDLVRRGVGTIYRSNAVRAVLLANNTSVNAQDFLTQTEGFTATKSFHTHPGKSNRIPLIVRREDYRGIRATKK